MSYNDSYGYEPRRTSRRAAREPAGSAKIQGSTAAAILIIVAIVGFGIGALIGNSGGDDPGGATAGDSDGAALSSPDDQTAAPDGTEGEQEAEDSTEPPTTSVTLEMDDTATAGEELEYEVRTEPAQPGLVLGVERRAPGGEWGPFGDQQVQAELDENGEDEGHVITSVTGETEWRVVGEIDGQRVESNVVTTTISEEEDNSGPGNGNDNGNGNGNDDD